jgi:uncharacterized coiled-coil DUF342 family protein
MMWRRPLLRVDIARTWQHAREQFAAVVAERDQLRRELAETKADRDELRARLVELLDAYRARRAAEDEVRALYREREIARARAVERDPAAPLQ